MIDVRLLRSDFDGVRTALARRNDDSALASLDRAVGLDERLREITAERDALRARVNTISKDVGALRRDGDVAGAEELQAQSRAIGETEKQLAAEHGDVSEQLRQELLVIPNAPS